MPLPSIICCRAIAVIRLKSRLITAIALHSMRPSPARATNVAWQRLLEVAVGGFEDRLGLRAVVRLLDALAPDAPRRREEVAAVDVDGARPTGRRDGVDDV